MEIYSSGKSSGLHWAKRLERLFQRIFLGTSAVIAAVALFAMISKISFEWMSEKTMLIFGKTLFTTWFVSFGLWIIFLIVNSRFAKFVKSFFVNRSPRKRIVGIVILLFLSLVLFLSFLYLFILRPNKVAGNSMEPNFINGDYFLSEKISYAFGDPKRGDVVVFTPPISNGKFFARIVGLPGERIFIKF